MNLKETISATARNLFMKCGVRGASMDDISKELSVSKKTLYTEFEDKNSLVESVVIGELQRIDSVIDDILESGVNPVQQVFNISKAMIETRKQENPSFMHDLRKYHPSVFDKLMAHRDDRSYKIVVNNLRAGQKQGFYRLDFDVEIISHIYINTCYELFNPVEYPMGNKSVEELYKQHLTYHFRGILNTKGLEEFKKTLW